MLLLIQNDFNYLLALASDRADGVGGGQEWLEGVSFISWHTLHDKTEIIEYFLISKVSLIFY